ncbi:MULTISPECIES: YdgA family protein [Pseudomonas]|uniref:YdgA family protein n=1 Tax=Pseudomonas quercus TaxID=2722792 RepID=A0ABX0YH33_9PSED|nr:MULTISPECIES: YdgA family protein [Pseudomonas]MBF7144124.1 YdgA family protein [Pseudomonas sp. LY10J]NJP02744.1 YdgA family protein [Pseudomonas quercus]
MSKVLPVVVGVVVIAGAAITGVAWYTGTQVEPLLRQQVVEANAQLKSALAGYPATVTLELTGFERRLFSSTAHYVTTAQGAGFNAGAPLRMEATADIEHGPFPWLRVKQLKLLPVMVAADYRTQSSPELTQLLGMPTGESPLQAYATVGYGRTLDSHIQILPSKWQSSQGTLMLSAVDGTVAGTLDSEKMDFNARVDSAEFTGVGPQGEVQLNLKGVSVHSGGIKGASGFYLGNSAFQADRLTVGEASAPLLEIAKLTAQGSLEELEGKLKGAVDYQVGQMNVAGLPIGSLQLRMLFDNLNIEAMRNLAVFYQNVVAPQTAQITLEQQPLQLQFTPQQQAQVQADLDKLLEGRPHMELQPVGLKTANGESHLSVALDLAKPTAPNLPPELLMQQMITRLDANLSLAKGTLRDLATVQGQLGGPTDPAALAKNAEGAANLAVTLATLQGLAKLEGEALVSSLHYENGMVDFNGQKLTLEQFAQFLMGAVGRG